MRRYSVDGGQIKYTAADGGETFSITGVKSKDGLSLSGKTVTVTDSALNNADVTISDGYSLTLASGISAPSTSAATWTYNNNVASYTGAATVAGYSVDGGQIKYTAADGGETFSISGVKSKDGLSLKDTIVTVTDTALNNSDVTISDGYSLTLASGISAPATTAAAWTYNNNIATYTNAATVAGYSVNNGQIKYTKANGGGSFTVSGVKSKDGLALSGTTVTVAESALDNKNVTISNDYTLALASDDLKPKTISATWTAIANGARCKDISTTAGYTVANNQIVYSAAQDGNIFTVTGVKDIDGLSLSGTVVTVSSKALSGANVTISDGYSLTLANDVSAPTEIKENLTYSNGTATYTAAATTSGYALNNNSIVYTAASGGEEVEISGVKSANGITVSDKTITIAASALNRKAVTIDDEDYSLALANGIANPTSTPEGWTLNGTKATYNSSGTTAGYTLSRDGKSISYTAEVVGKTIVEVSGVKDINGLKFDQRNKVVTVSTAALNQETVTISDGYTLALANDVEKSKTVTGWIKLESGNMTYQTESTSTGYKLEDNQISYVDTAIEGETLAEFSGISEESTPALDSEKKIITFAKDNFADNVAVISSKFRKFELTAGDYEDKTFTATGNDDSIDNVGSKLTIDGGTGNDRVNNSGSDVTINGGTGNDVVTLSGGEESGNTFVYTVGDGNDILYNFNENDTIKVIGTKDIEPSIKNKDTVFKIGKGSITIRDAAKSNMTITVFGESEDEIISSDTYTTEGIISDDKIVLPTTQKKEYKQAENTGVVDGSKMKKGIKIIGNDEGGTLIGGEGKDTLISSQNDFELTGGAGNDIFIFGGGKDTITDYSAKGTGGADKVSIAASLTATGYEIDGGDVILSYGTGNDLTIIDGKNKNITFAGKKSTIRIYEDAGVLDGKKKSLTLAANTEKKFSATGTFKKLITIDGSQVDNEIAITGNVKANYIIAGKSNTTLDGGKGRDTLVGGESEDVFIYNAKTGNKTIQNYGEDDIINLSKGATISQVTTKKGNVVLKVGNNTITIEDTAKFNYTQNGDTITYDNSKLVSDKSVTLASDFKDKSFDLNAEGNDTYSHVSAELGKKAITLIGDADENSLTGGKGKDSLYGGENADTLNGGKGNDSLWGGEGKDTFVYKAGEGTDTIMDYNAEDGDLLQIIDKRGRTISKGAVKNWTFDDDNLILSIKGGGKLILAGVGKKSTINVNGTAQSF